MLSKVPGTRTTGCGCAVVGLHDQSLAPGGATSTVSADAATGVASAAAAAVSRARTVERTRTGHLFAVGAGDSVGPEARRASSAGAAAPTHGAGRCDVAGRGSDRCCRCAAGKDGYPAPSSVMHGRPVTSLTP